MAVGALRDVFKCVHPSFVLGDIDRSESLALVPNHDVPDEEPASFPRDADHLRELVDQALVSYFGQLPIHDDDGDVPIRCGGSVVFVRVMTERPAVEIFSQIVVDVYDDERLLLELDILNRNHEVIKFFTRHGYVIVRQVLPAVPFLPEQLRMFLQRFCDQVDDAATDLIARVGGQKPAEVDCQEEAEDADEDRCEELAEDQLLTTGHPSLLALLEMLCDGRLPSAQVAALFDYDRHELVEQLAAIRTGRQALANEILTEFVLDHLRRGLRYTVELQTGGEHTPEPRPLPPKPRSQQLSLIPEQEQSMVDVEDWDQEVS